MISLCVCVDVDGAHLQYCDVVHQWTVHGVALHMHVHDADVALLLQCSSTWCYCVVHIQFPAQGVLLVKTSLMQSQRHCESTICGL